MQNSDGVTASSGLGAVDLLVIIAYLGLLAVIAWRSRRKTESTDDYFLAGHGIPWWAAACSFMATALSAATFVGVPYVGYAGDLTYLSANLAAMVAIVVVAALFLPAFYRTGSRTVYDLLGHRFGPMAAQMASISFLLGRTFASGARLFIAALAVAYLVTLDPDPGAIAVLIIFILVGVGLAYAFVGGIRAVIWTDVCQAGIFVLAAVAAISVLLIGIEAPFTDIWYAWLTGKEDGSSKLQVFSLGLQVPESESAWPAFMHPVNEFSLPSLLLGMALINLGAYGTDQDLAQRLLACRDAKRGAWSAFTAVGMAIPVTFLFLMVGLLLWVYYHRPDLVGHDVAAPDQSGRLLFPGFIAFDIPLGLRGLLAAGLIAAAVSSLTSELNAMGSTFLTDCYRNWKKGGTDRHYLRVGRLAVICSAFALSLFAASCLVWQRADSGSSLLSFALGVMGFAYSGLVGVFLAALLTKRGNQWSAIFGLAVGSASYAMMKFSSINDDVCYTWQMLVATVLAFVVCCLGRTANEQRT